MEKYPRHFLCFHGVWFRFLINNIVYRSNSNDSQQELSKAKQELDEAKANIKKMEETIDQQKKKNNVRNKLVFIIVVANVHI